MGADKRLVVCAAYLQCQHWYSHLTDFRARRTGEDAWLNEQVATEYVLGLQDGPATGDTMLLATAACKHILIYDSQQPNTRDVNASLHDLHDYYLRPWRACATVGATACVSRR